MTDCCNCSINRPGGYKLTERGIELCGFFRNAKIADVGCGNGGTVRYLAYNHGADIIGVDIEVAYAASGDSWRIITADAAVLPFENSVFDGVIFECSLSKIKNPDAALNESFRVLKNGGKLLITDLYARGEAAELQGILGRLERWDDISHRTVKHGFQLLNFEDHTEVIKQMWAELVFENGIDALYDDVGADAETLKRIKCGYYLAVWKK